MQPADQTRDLYGQPTHGRVPPKTRQQAQVDQVLRAFGKGVGRGPANWREVGVAYLYREQRILVRDEYVDQVLAFINGSAVERSLIHGVTLLSVPGETIAELNRVRGRFGSGVATPDHLVSITGGEAGLCPATEPEVVPGWAMPDPVPTTDHRAGEGIRVVVVDTGLDPTAAASHPWLSGVWGDADPAIGAGVLGAYAGHGTFIAGIVRCLAPRAEVIVRSVFHTGGATFESDLVEALDKVLQEDSPDVISMSAGAWTFDPTGLLSLNVFHETRLRHHKGVVLVAEAVELRVLVGVLGLGLVEVSLEVVELPIEQPLGRVVEGSCEVPLGGLPVGDRSESP